MTVTAGSQAAGLRQALKEWRFEATPPRDSPNLLAGRRDTCTVTVRVRCTGQMIHFIVNDEAVASTRRTALRSWISRRTRAPYIEGRLIFKSSGTDVWLEVEGAVAPTLLVPRTIQNILTILSD